MKNNSKFSVLRDIGLIHRVKKTVEGTAHPTLVAIRYPDGKTTRLELEFERDELDYMSGKYPIEWKKVEKVDDLEGVWIHHIKTRKLKDKEDPNDFGDLVFFVPKKKSIIDELSKQLGRGSIYKFKERKKKGKKAKPENEKETLPEELEGDWHLITKIPSKYEGIQSRDRILCTLGGSGNRMTAAASYFADKVGARVYRTPSFNLKDFRLETAPKTDDPVLLTKLIYEQPEKFYFMRGVRDRNMIRVTELFRLRMEAVKERLKCEQRIRTSFEGEIYLSEEGGYPEGDFELLYEAALANDEIYTQLRLEESRRDRALAIAIEDLDVWKYILKDVEGVGPRIAAGIVSAIVDIHRFMVEPDPKAIEKLRSEIGMLMDRANYQRDYKKIPGIEKKNGYERISAVRRYKAEVVKNHVEADLLTKAMNLKKKEGELISRALQKTASKVKAFCGVHVENIETQFCKECTLALGDRVLWASCEHSDMHTMETIMVGRFPRRRRSTGGGSEGRCNWHGGARQSAVQVAEQFTKRKNSKWGMILLEVKANYRRIHPVPICKKCSTYQNEVAWNEEDHKGHTRRYSDMHIKLMAEKKVMGMFIEWLAKEWVKLERKLALKDGTMTVKDESIGNEKSIDENFESGEFDSLAM